MSTKHEREVDEWKQIGARRVVGSIPEPAVITDRDGTIRLTSRTIQSQFGWRDNAILGESLAVLVSEADRSALARLLARCRDSMLAFDEGNSLKLEARHADGRLLPCNLHLIRLDLLEDSELFFMAILHRSAGRSISPQLELMHRLAHVGSIATRLCHQVNNSLASIKNVTTLLSGILPEDHPDARFLTMVSMETDRAAAAVRHIMDVYDPGQASFEEYSVAASIQEVLSQVRAEAESAYVSIAPGFIEPSIRVALPHRLVREVTFQLLRNAIEASARGSTVHINAEVSKHDLRIWVRDMGSGIAAGLATKIFEPFFSTREDHLGLGLSICKQLAGAMGGAVTIERSIPQGTRAEFVVPLG